MGRPVLFLVLSRIRKGKNLNTSPLAHRRSDAALRPADECPWPRPFPEGFEECPAFAPLAFSPVDSRDRPLGPVLTCRHLISRPFNLPKAGWYGACGLGDAPARRAYLERKVVAVVKAIS
jgi:hypothetical protein